MWFERPRHQAIAQLLRALDAEVLCAHHCLFGGGTAMAMRFGEYRESVDVDFLVSDSAGYRGMRAALRDGGGLTPVLRSAVPPLETLRAIRADQYGIRMQVTVADVPIKFEIVREARITLDAPTARDELCGIATLTRTDMAASKLLANSDRGLDDSTFNRDLLDLAMLAPDAGVLKRALTKAEGAYGVGVRRDLAGSVERLRSRDGWLETCMRQLAMRLPPATVWARVRKLARGVERLA